MIRQVDTSIIKEILESDMYFHRLLVTSPIVCSIVMYQFDWLPLSPSHFPEMTVASSVAAKWAIPSVVELVGRYADRQTEYVRPQEIACYSRDSERRVLLDRSQMVLSG